MLLLKIIKNSSKVIKPISGGKISIKLKQGLNKGKIINLDNWFIISVKNKNSYPSLTIAKKIEEVFIKKIIKIDSPLIKEYIIHKKNKKVKKSKFYKFFKKLKN